ncbi:MAG: sigma 54-interacting transcriptional regulator [Bacteroidota bacterium]
MCNIVTSCYTLPQKDTTMVESFHNYQAKNESLHRNWTTFIDSGKVPKDLQEYIQHSWLRCKDHNIDTDLAHSPVNMDETGKILFLKENQFLIDQSRPHLQKLMDSVDSEALVITLANHKSEVISTLGKNLKQAEKINLIPGSRWSEEDCGTNGIGTALKETRALSIFGFEHYCHSWHELVCTSSPILDPFTQKTLGAITLSGPKDFVPLHNVAFANHIAKMIENSIYDHIQFSVASNYLSHFHSNNPIVIFDEYFQIKYVNLEAIRSLHLTVGEHFQLFPGKLDLMNSVTITNQYKDYNEKKWNVSTLPFIINNRILGRIAVFEKAISISAPAIGKASLKPITLDHIVTENTQVKNLKALASQYARTDLNVLITGETGTGKELFAKAIHNCSERRDKPFVVVNCGAIPKDLIASELFGYVEGAFTSALKGGKQGKFTAAQNGTIFLDEIGELPMDLQPYLLRVLEEGMVYPVGSTEGEVIDVRIIAATNRNLQSAISAGAFRDDLYYRLNILNLYIPPIRERKEDIPALLSAFLKEQNFPSIQVDREVFHMLQSHEWLGNVRELRSCFHRILFTFQLHSKRNIITVKDIPEEYRGIGPSIPPNLEKIPRHLTIEEALKITKGNKSRAADLLGISRMTLYRKLGKN